MLNKNITHQKCAVTLKTHELMLNACLDCSLMFKKGESQTIGDSDLAQHFLFKAGIIAISRLRKTDHLRLARACGATIVNHTEELTEKDVGLGAGLFEIKKIGDEYFTFITKCLHNTPSRSF
uniref:Uncharacterized protein n=1 Tax=Megaselia scalaris TaxID=36166 RepID=T1H191_MEGSC